MPISSVSVVAGDVAVPLLLNAAVPIDVPPVAQSEVLVAIALGLHKKNDTVPVGIGAGETGKSFTKSVTDVPGVTVVEVVLDVVLIGASCFIVSKHSVSELVCSRGL